MQVGEPPEDPGRLIVEAPFTGWPVVLLGQANVPGAVEDALDAHPSLDSGQGGARAGVGAASKRDVRLGVGAISAELGRALEASRISVGPAVEQHDRGAGGDL